MLFIGKCKEKLGEDSTVDQARFGSKGIQVSW